ncbi:MAG: threonylcarbamoyl-AMP synthase [Myxococcales bacterium]|nr:threonylcarbamoyl-AMP synthase [Myxococcales bacterium]
MEVLRGGGLVALPTETVYGLGADAQNELAARRIFAVKGRPSTHPLIVHVASLEDARAWVAEVPPEGELLARAFWPGPLTLVLRRSALASDTVTGGQDTVAIRVPAHEVALKLLRAFDGGIAAPSANRFGKVSPTTAQHVREELGEDVDFILDAGPSQVGVESTIVDVTGAAPRLLRPGGLAREALEEALGRPLALATQVADVRAPGMLESHYAPRAGLWLVDAPRLAAEASRRLDEGVRVVVLAPASAVAPAAVIRLDVPEDATGFAQVLYARLREADRLGEVILAVPPPESGLGLAVRDRLARAAAPRR